MLRLPQLRLSSLRHFKSRFFTMDGATSHNHIPSRNIATNPARPSSGFYTHNSSFRHRHGLPSGRPRPSTRSLASSPLRRYYSNYGGSGSGGGGLSVDQAFWILFGINAASFGAWWYARLTNNRFLLQLHLDNTLTSLAAWDSGRWWTVITSAFTHHDVMHFAFNMLTLRTFCEIIGFVPGIGGGHVLLLALGAALCGSGGWLLQQKSKLASLRSPGRWGNNALNSASAQIYHASALGASGVVMGVSAVATCLLPSMPISLMFIPIGIPLWVVTIGYAVVDTFFLNSTTTRVAHSGHLGGMVCGAAYYLAFLRHSPVGVWRSLSYALRRR